MSTLRSLYDAATGPTYVSTGHLPQSEMVQQLVAEAYERYRPNTDGLVSDVYPALARVASDLFGICVVGTSGVCAPRNGA